MLTLSCTYEPIRSIFYPQSALMNSLITFPSEAQVEQNSRNQNPGISPIILWQQEQEEKAKAAIAAKPIDVKAMMSKIDRK